MKQYLDLGRELIAKFDRLGGRIRRDRTGVGTVSVFGRQIRFDLQQGFPLLTSKKVFLRGIIEELIWILAGDTNNNTLKNKDVKIWDQWATEDGSLGPIYGAQWRFWKNSRQATSFTIAERHALAAQLLHENEATFSEEDFSRLERCYGLAACPSNHEERLNRDMQKYVHDMFNSWGIPKGTEEPAFFDQIAILRDGLLKKPYSRRHIVSAWNVSDLPDESIGPQDNVRQGRMALAPCHTLMQFYVEDMTLMEITEYDQKQNPLDSELFQQKLDMVHTVDEETEKAIRHMREQMGMPTKKLSCQLYQRSADYILGVPFNIASYALLTMMLAQVTNMAPGEFIHTFGDLHIYKNHIDKFREQLDREPRALPRMILNPTIKDLFAFKYEDFKLEVYDPHPAINYGGVAV